MILTRIERFPTAIPIWIHRWLRNKAQSLRGHRRCALLFCEVICPISRSQGTKNRRLGSNLSVSRWQLQFEFTNSFEKTRIASRSMEEVLYCFSGSHGLTSWFESDSIKITRAVAAIKSLKFALLRIKCSSAQRMSPSPWTQWIKEITLVDHGNSSQIAKAIRSISVRHRSDTKVSDRCLIDVDTRVFAIWETVSLEKCTHCTAN